MNKQTVVKFVVKGALGLVVSASIGYAIKGERQLAVKIDEYFTNLTADITND